MSEKSFEKTSTKNSSLPKIFAGWWIVLTGGIVTFWVAGYYTYGFSALFKPIAAELGFSRTATSVPASIGRLEGGIEAPVAGWITDKFGPRWPVFIGVFVVGLSLILMNWINALWAFYLVWGVMFGISHGVATGVPIDTAVANWFVKKRGMALSVKQVFTGLSGVLVLPLIAWLIIVQGWRTACVIGGLIIWIVGLPLVWFLLKQHRPEYYGLLPDGAKAGETKAERMIDSGVKYAAGVQEVEFTLRQALRTPAFWVLTTANAVHAMAQPAINLHGVPFLTDIGIDPLVAAGILAMMVFVSVPFRVAGGFISDRVSRGHLRFIIAGAYFMQAIGFTVYLLFPSMLTIYLWFILYGIGLGAAMAPLPAMRARYFGRKAFGSIQGLSMLLITPVGVAAPIYAGWVFDTTGSYITAFTWIAALLGVSAVFALFILPPKPPEHITDINKIV